MHRPSRSSRSPIRPQQVCSTRKAVTRARERGGGALRPRSLKTGKRRLVKRGIHARRPDVSPVAWTQSVSPRLPLCRLSTPYFSSFLNSRLRGAVGEGGLHAGAERALCSHTNWLISLWGDYLQFQATSGIFYQKLQDIKCWGS